jgi:hypothetical protein
MVYVVLVRRGGDAAAAAGGRLDLGDERRRRRAEICTEIAPAEAQAAVLDGQVRRIRVLVDQDQPVETLTGIVLELRDDACRQTPQGREPAGRAVRVSSGAVQLYNQFNEDAGVAIAYTEQDIQRELLATATPVPTETPTVPAASPTGVIVVPPLPTETPVATATATATATASATVRPAASPRAGTPASSPAP